ncbi:MAG TPA: group 1 glycosyl transferase [Nitrospira sp.]|nr:group 1 glycosyl transferase [Nitrospira sp.]
MVGEKVGDDPHVIPLSQASTHHDTHSSIARFSRTLSSYEGRLRGIWRMRRWLEAYVAHPDNWWETCLGRDHFNFPETWRLLALSPADPDILHCHNLHGGWLSRGGYFDLRALPELCRTIPTIITLHDTWMLSGHCAYTLGCERWKTGCGHCPDLSIYPAISRDGTAENWQRKRDIYAACRLYVSTPSRWLLHQVEQSILAPAIIQGRVIPNGVDLSHFCPGSQRVARTARGLPQDAAILLFVANQAKSNMFKDYRTVERCAITTAARYQHRKVLLLVLGEQGEPVVFENGEVQFIAFQRDANILAQYYQAADVYVHAAKSDTFPNTVLEALACGLPVVATAVDGIPEQIEESQSGYLVQAGDADTMASRVIQLLSSEGLRTSMGTTAADIASRSFGIQRQVQAYLDWYEQILDSSQLAGRNAHAC